VRTIRTKGPGTAGPNGARAALERLRRTERQTERYPGERLSIVRNLEVCREWFERVFGADCLSVAVLDEALSDGTLPTLRVAHCYALQLDQLDDIGRQALERELRREGAGRGWLHSVMRAFA